MAAGYRVQNLRLQSGERLSLLVEAATGVPLWNPTLFVLTELRATNRASATIQQATRALKVAHQVLDHLRIDLNARLAEGRLLDVGELDEMVHLAGLTQEALDGLVADDVEPGSRPLRILSTEKLRMHATPVDSRHRIGAETKGIRLMYIRNYIEWLAHRKLLRFDSRDPERQALTSTAQLVIRRLSERIPTPSRNNDVGMRQGVGPDVCERIIQVIHPDSPENPWKNTHVRARNHLIFLWLLELGLRKSELLGIRLGDIDLRSGEVLIARRADDPLETRKDAPHTKTKDRLLVMTDDLAELTRAYLHGARRAIKPTRSHPYLFVATGTGRPLTKSAVTKLFIELRTRVPELPDELSPHVLRHTWNDKFSALMDERGVSPEDEERMRKQQMGWSDTSRMAALYTRRHTQRKANEASLAMQAASFGMKKRRT